MKNKFAQFIHKLISTLGYFTLMLIFFTFIPKFNFIQTDFFRFITVFLVTLFIPFNLLDVFILSPLFNKRNPRSTLLYRIICILSFGAFSAIAIFLILSNLTTSFSHAMYLCIIGVVVTVISQIAVYLVYDLIYIKGINRLLHDNTVNVNAENTHERIKVDIDGGNIKIDINK